MSHDNADSSQGGTAGEAQPADGPGSSGAGQPGAQPRRFPMAAPVTGDALVDQALSDAADAQDGDPAEQLETYVGTHRSLQERLADSGT